jgi:hypothetical protein
MILAIFKKYADNNLGLGPTRRQVNTSFEVIERDIEEILSPPPVFINEYGDDDIKYKDSIYSVETEEKSKEYLLKCEQTTQYECTKTTAYTAYTLYYNAISDVSGIRRIQEYKAERGIDGSYTIFSRDSYTKPDHIESILKQLGLPSIK